MRFEVAGAKSQLFACFQQLLFFSGIQGWCRAANAAAMPFDDAEMHISSLGRGDPRLSQQITGLPGDGDRKSMTAGDGKIADRVNSEYERFASGDTNWRQESTGVFEPAVGSKFVAGSQQAIIAQTSV